MKAIKVDGYGIDKFPIFYTCTTCGHLYFCFDEHPDYVGQKCSCYRFNKKWETEKYELE